MSCAQPFADSISQVCVGQVSLQSAPSDFQDLKFYDYTQFCPLLCLCKS